MKVLKNRAEPVLKYIKGDVLDIGCVGMGSNDVYGGADFIHGEVKQKAKSLVGVDINKEGAMALREKGFDIIVQDAQEPFNLKRKFDVVLSEENIEHISNLKTYLDNVKKHLKDDGVFLITTPNAICFDYFVHVLFWGKPRVNLSHTHVHNELTIRYLLESNGFEVLKIEKFQAINWKIQNFGGKVMWFAARLIPQRFGRNMFILAKKKIS